MTNISFNISNLLFPETVFYGHGEGYALTNTFQREVPYYITIM